MGLLNGTEEPGAQRQAQMKKDQRDLNKKPPAQVINKPPMWGKTRLWIIIQFLRRYRRCPDRRLKSSFVTPMMMFSSLDPWSIIFTLILACARAAKILAAVPRIAFMPRPTTAITARSDSNVTTSG